MIRREIKLMTSVATLFVALALGQSAAAVDGDALDAQLLGGPIRSTLSVVDMIDAAHGYTIVGASTLERRGRSVHMTVHTTSLTPGSAFTAWWVIFNRPERCSGGECGLDDVFGDPKPARTSVMYASGFIAGQDGIGNTSATLHRGHSSGEVLFGPGLVNVRGAEIHVIVRDHGQPFRWNGGRAALNLRGWLRGKHLPRRAGRDSPRPLLIRAPTRPGST